MTPHQERAADPLSPARCTIKLSGMAVMMLTNGANQGNRLTVAVELGFMLWDLQPEMGAAF
jgi:hypothetical protein